MGMEYVIDPDETPHALGAANGISVFAPVKSVPAPTEKLWASNIDTEGELAAGSKTGNSEHTLTLRLVGASEEQFRQRQGHLEQKLHKLDTEGGILRVIYPDTSYIDWEVRAIAIGEKLLDNRFVHHKRTQDEVTFICAPFGEEAEELLAEFEGEAQRVLECIIEGIGGSAPALGRAVITSPNVDVWDLKHGRDSRRYSSAETAKAYYPATDLTPLGGATSTTATVDGQAETPVVRQATLTPTPQAMLSTEIDGVGHMTHEGNFEVIVWLHMPQAADLGIYLEHGIGEMLKTARTPEIYLDSDDPRLGGSVVQLSLGDIFLRAAANGNHHWQGRVVVSSPDTVGRDLDLLGFALRPLEANGSVSAPVIPQDPTVFKGRDEFEQSAEPPATLSGKEAPVGGPWTSLGEGADFFRPEGGEAGALVRRTEASDPDWYAGKEAVLDLNLATAAARVDFRADAIPDGSLAENPLVQGLTFCHQGTGARKIAAVRRTTAEGVDVVLQEAVEEDPNATVLSASVAPLSVDDLYTIAFLQVSNFVVVFLGPKGGVLAPVLRAGADRFVDGLPAGDVGIYDAHVSETASTRDYMNFAAWIPQAAPAIHAAKSLALHHDRVEREEAEGIWTPITGSGDYLKLAPAGREGRKNRLVFIPSPRDPDTMGVGFPDDLKVAVYGRRRHRVIPDHA